MLFSARLSPVAAILRTRPALPDVTPSLRRELWFLGRTSLYQVLDFARFDPPGCGRGLQFPRQHLSAGATRPCFAFR